MRRKARVLQRLGHRRRGIAGVADVADFGQLLGAAQFRKQQMGDAVGRLAVEVDRPQMRLRELLARAVEQADDATGDRRAIRDGIASQRATQPRGGHEPQAGDLLAEGAQAGEGGAYRAPTGLELGVELVGRRRLQTVQQHHTRDRAFKGCQPLADTRLVIRVDAHRGQTGRLGADPQGPGMRAILGLAKDEQMAAQRDAVLHRRDLPGTNDIARNAVAASLRSGRSAFQRSGDRRLRGGTRRRRVSGIDSRQLSEQRAQRTRSREAFHVRLHGIGDRGRGLPGEGTDDLDPLDRVDAEVGFQIGVEADHVLRITGAIRHQRQQRRLGVEIGRRGRRGRPRRGNCRRARRLRQLGQQRAQRARAGEAFHIRLHGLGDRGRGLLGEGADNLDPLDRVDAEVGLQIGLEADHVFRIAGAIRHQRQQRRLGVESRRGRFSRRARCRRRGRFGGLRLRSRGLRRGGNRRLLRSHAGGRRCRHRRLAGSGLGGQPAEHAAHDLFLQMQELLHGPLIGGQRLLAKARDACSCRCSRHRRHLGLLCCRRLRAGSRWGRGSRRGSGGLGPLARGLLALQRQRRLAAGAALGIILRSRAAAGKIEGGGRDLRRLEQPRQRRQRMARDAAIDHQPCDRHVHAGAEQLADGIEQTAQAAALPVEADDGRIVLGQRRARHAGADGLGAAFDEAVDTVGRHRLQLADEFHRREQVALELLGDRSRVVGMRAAVIAVDLALRRVEVGRVDRRAERLLRGGDELGMESAGDRQLRRPDLLLLGLVDHRIHGVGRPGDHDLLGGVVIGDPDAAGVGQQRVDLLARGLHGRHGANAVAGGIGHGRAARRRQPQEGLAIDHAGGVQRGVLAIAVTGHRLRCNTQPPQQIQITQRQRADGGLSVPGIGNGLLLRFARGVAEGGLGPHQARQGPLQLVAQHFVGALQRFAQFGVVERDLAPHADRLRPLTGEQQAHPPPRTTMQIAAHARRQGLVLGQMRAQALDLLAQRVVAVRHEGRHAGCLRHLLRFRGQRVRDLGDAERVAGGQRGVQLLHLRLQGSRVGGAEDEELPGPATRAYRLGHGVAAAVLLEHGVEVRATEAEGRHGAAARVIGAAQPGPRLVEQIGGRILGGDGVDRVLDADMRRQHAVMQRQGHLDEAADAGGALGMTENRLDRAQRHALGRCAVVAPAARDGLRLGAVAHRRAGAVRLDQLHRLLAEAGLAVDAIQRAYLAFRPRRGHAQRLAVGGAGSALDHGIDAVAVSLGVGQALEHDHRHALGDGYAIRVLVEGARNALGRQRLRLREAEEAVRPLHRVHTAGDGDVRAPCLQLLGGQRHRRQRGAAGRVHREIEAAEVHAVGDTAGRHVLQHAGEGFVGPLRQPLPGAVVGKLDEARQLGAHAVLHAQIADTATRAEDDRGVLAVEVVVEAGVVERARRALQRQQLHRVDGFHRARRNAEAQRIEGDLVEEAAPLRIHLVARIHVGVEVQTPVPALPRHLPDDADLLDDVVPEAVGVARAGQHHADADHRHIGGRSGLAARFDVGLQLEQALCAARRHVLVQFGTGHDLITHGRHLANHIHAVALLLPGVDRDDLAGVVAHAALRGQPQPAQIQILQRVADLLGGLPRRQQLSPLVEELAREGGIHAAGRMAGPRFQAGRVPAGQRLVLIALHHGTAGDDLLGEQIGRAHQAPDADAALGQWRG